MVYNIYIMLNVLSIATISSRCHYHYDAVDASISRFNCLILLALFMRWRFFITGTDFATVSRRGMR